MQVERDKIKDNFSRVYYLLLQLDNSLPYSVKNIKSYSFESSPKTDWMLFW